MRFKIKQSYLGDNKYKYELFDGDYCWGEMVQNFDWNQLEIGAILDFQADKYTIDRIYDCKESPEENEVIIYELKRILADILIGLN